MHHIPKLFLLRAAVLLLLLLSSVHHLLNVALVGDQLVLGVVPERVLAILADDIQGWEDIDGVIDSALNVFELYVLIWILLWNVAKNCDKIIFKI